MNNTRLSVPNNDHLIPRDTTKGYGWNNVFDVTLSFSELSSLNLAIKDRLATYEAQGYKIEEAHPTSHIGTLNAIHQQIEDAQHGRRYQGHRFNVRVIGDRE